MLTVLLPSLIRIFAVLVISTSYSSIKAQPDTRSVIAEEMDHSVRNEMLNKWYPLAKDTLYGGYLSSFTYDWKPAANQDKMIVTQARHLWSNATASMFYPNQPMYKPMAEHGFRFLRDVMWDKSSGGFFTLVERNGTIKNNGEDKTAYGNAFGIYALSTYFKSSGDTGALNLAKQAFLWLEDHSHDPVHKGYFQHLTRNGTRVIRTKDVPSTAETGYKDQNSSIHLLEAFTELYSVWPDQLVRKRLQEMLVLIRDKMVNKKGYLVLFFKPDWTPVTFKDSSEATILRHHNLDHVSFGHDVETAYLMLEASHQLGIKNDKVTMTVAKRMIDHSLQNGWDKSTGGFFDEAYYFKGKQGITVTRDTKNWWAQAEGLNSLLLFANHFPKDKMKYFEKFQTLWNYAKLYLIDHEHGDWYEGGLDKQPEKKTALKGNIWKGNYHQLRSLTNCIKALKEKH